MATDKLLETISFDSNGLVPAIAQQHDIKKWCKGLGIGGQYRSATKHDWMLVGARVAPDRDALLFQQIEQDWSVEFPAERKPK